MAKSNYAILGIPENAGKQEVKSAYRRLAKCYHPDQPGGDSRKFRDVQEAYSALVDTPGQPQDKSSRPVSSVRVRTAPPRRAAAGHFHAEPLIPEQDVRFGQDPGQSRRSSGFEPPGEDLFEWVLRRFF